MVNIKKDYKLKAKEAEKRAKELVREKDAFLERNTNKSMASFTDEILQKTNDIEISLANAYWEAAENWIAAKNPKKAIECYHLAGRTYGDLFQNRFTKRKDVEEYRARCYKAIRYQERLEKVRRGKWHGLEGMAKTTAIVGILGGIFLLSSGITGNVIGSLNQTSSNWIGGALFLVGLLGAFLYFRKR
jgi:hypothetical protein